ncbi:Rox3-domain-containing protein [Lindgomyces ingoldianus]|uniref:Rox3-domain-containing protein n=1 Tax=Lindgomyces ingoldianus TaxID=673940 RepID=A0ACB6R034_9PLEO|nr:Rox3-domain-containing protein [Lindgomyces ingoldianus]KAF2472150.1 Rox3-domain-containing protein [Lindgomyces ingoldianus]
MTPPSSVSMSQQVSQPGASALNPLPFPTPSSTTGVVSANVDSDGDAMMVDDANDDATRPGGNRRSNHNRQGKGKAVVFGEKGIFGSLLFKVGENEHSLSRPHGSQNLFELYGLNDIASTVARTDPRTGEKINKLRKSYEGHIKALQIAGRPKAVKMEGALIGPLLYTDSDFDAARVAGREIKNALNDDESGLSKDFETLLNGALAGMAPGPLPNPDNARYKAYLGTDEAKPKPVFEGQLSRGLPPNPGTPFSSAPSPAPRSVRPERSGAKRSYQDTSFVGYSEGFADDADSTAGEEAGPKKRPKLGFGAAHQIGMVGGVRR